MARIFYSMAGEGRGHAVRVRTLVEHLRHDHELWLFAPDEAYDFLARFYGRRSACPHVKLLRIPGLRFHYSSGRLDLAKSIASGLSYTVRVLPGLVSAFQRRIRAVRPELVIADFEPSLPRAARLERVPLISLDHQHVLTACDLSTLPGFLQRYAWAMSWVVRWCCSGPTEIVASSFFTAPLKRGWEHVHQVGPMIRPEVAQLVPQTNEYLLSYLRANTPETVVSTLASAELPVIVYGLGQRPPQGRLTFRPIHEQQFVEDLSGCRAVVCAAGNQLLGESLYLGKPVLAIPEARHHEQLINAHFLAQMQAGTWCALEDFGPDALQRFLRGLDRYQAAAIELCGLLDGTQDALHVIHNVLVRTAARDSAASLTI